MSRTFSLMLLIAVVTIAGCSWETERQRWRTWGAETREDLRAATGTSEYTGMSSRAREIERSMDAHRR